MVIFKLKKFNDINDKSLTSGFVILTYATISSECNGINVTGEFDIEVPTSIFNRVNQNIKMTGTFDDIYNYYYKA